MRKSAVITAIVGMFFGATSYAQGMQTWQNCSEVRALTLDDFGITPGQPTGIDYLDNYRGATIFNKSGRTYKWQGQSYDIFVDSGKVLSAGESAEVAGSYETGVDEFTVQNIGSLPAGVTELTQIFMPIGAGSYVIIHEVDCSSNSSSAGGFWDDGFSDDNNWKKSYSK